MTVLIDRSYCPASEWQQVIQTYAELYQQHQQRRLQLRTVIFSHLGEESFPTPPEPAALQQISTYGRPDSQQQLRLQKRYPQSQLLQCNNANLHRT